MPKRTKIAANPFYNKVSDGKQIALPVVRLHSTTSSEMPKRCHRTCESRLLCRNGCYEPVVALKSEWE
jgi:hypothetical protein